MHLSLNYWAVNGTFNHLPLHHFAIAAPHHLQHNPLWQGPLCWPRYCCEDAVWHLESFQWIGFEFSDSTNLLKYRYRPDFSRWHRGQSRFHTMGSFGPKLSCRTLTRWTTLDQLASIVDPWLCYHRKSELHNFSPGRLQHGFFIRIGCQWSHSSALLAKVRVCSSKIYFWFSADIYFTLHKKKQ